MKIPTAAPVLSVLITALLLTSCAPGPRLESRPATTVAPDTSYTLILHGCNFGNDLATIAFLRREDQPYLFQPHSPEFQYRIQENLPDMLDVFHHIKGGKVLIYVNPIPHEDDLDDDV